MTNLLIYKHKLNRKKFKLGYNRLKYCSLIMLAPYLTTLFLVTIKTIVAQSQSSKSDNDQLIEMGSATVACKLFHLLAMSSEEQQNILISPFITAVQLSTLVEGSRGKTALEIATALSWNKQRANDVRQQIKNRFMKLNDVNKQEGFRMKLGIQLFVQNYFKIAEDYKRVISEYYNTGMTGVNFNIPSSARSVVSTWLARFIYTDSSSPFERYIKDKGSLLTVAAFSYNALWTYGFSAERTHVTKFFIRPEASVNVVMMHQTSSFNYAEFPDLGFRALELPYGPKGEVGMYICLPEMQNDLERLQDLLALRGGLLLGMMNKAMTKEMVEICIPKFQMSKLYDLRRTLFPLNIRKIFDPYLSNMKTMSHQDSLYLSGLLQWNNIEFKESGHNYESDEKASIRRIFCANHPFIYFIRNNIDGNLLLLGQFADPLGLTDL